MVHRWIAECLDVSVRKMGKLLGECKTNEVEVMNDIIECRVRKSMSGLMIDSLTRGVADT